MNTDVDEETKRQRAEALDNSRPLYMWRLSEFPAAKGAINHIFNELVDAGIVKKRYRKKWRDLTRAILLDLYVAHQTDPEMYVSYSRNPNSYKVGSRYGSFFLSWSILAQLIEYLVSNGYVEHILGFQNTKDPSKSRVSRMRATPKLVRIFRDEYQVAEPMIRHNPDEQVIILRDAGEKDIEYQDTPEIIQMRENVHLINKNLEKHAILLFVKDTELEKLQKRLNRKLNFSDKRVRRIFNNSSWYQGGRFFGGWWQNVPREYRKYIRINGKDVVECDYSGLHINMLYVQSGLAMPAGDVYQLPGYSNDKTFRDFVKRLLLIMINASDRAAARKAIHHEVHFKRSLVLPDEIPSTKAVDLDPLMNAFETKHTAIKGYFCTGVGIDLQNKDSKIAEQVLLRFSEMGYAILPMHDSFILHHGLEAELREAMEEAFKEMFGVSCKVDLKYNSIHERHKEHSSCSGECNLPLRQIYNKYQQYSRHETLLAEHRKAQESLIRGTVSGPDEDQ